MVGRHATTPTSSAYPEGDQEGFQDQGRRQGALHGNADDEVRACKVRANPPPPSPSPLPPPSPPPPSPPLLPTPSPPPPRPPPPLAALPTRTRGRSPCLSPHLNPTRPPSSPSPTLCVSHFVSHFVSCLVSHGSVDLFAPLIDDPSDPVWVAWTTHVQYVKVMFKKELTYQEVRASHPSAPP